MFFFAEISQTEKKSNEKVFKETGVDRTLLKKYVNGN